MSWAPLLIPLLAVTVASAAFWFSTRAARATAAAGIHAVDASAYTRASSIYESTISSLRADITDLRAELIASRTEIRELRTEIARQRRDTDGRPPEQA